LQGIAGLLRPGGWVIAQESLRSRAPLCGSLGQRLAGAGMQWGSVQCGLLAPPGGDV